VYTQSHIDYVVEVILEVWKNRKNIQGMKLTYEAPFLRHFTARLEPVEMPVGVHSLNGR
jgi:tryptophanase